LTSTTFAVPPLGSTAKDFGRKMTSLGSGPPSFTSTIFVAPKICVWAVSVEGRSLALLIRVEPVRACSRPATSRLGYVRPNRIRLGWCSSTSCFSAWAAGCARWSS
jgi:hypothetical protein